MLTNRFQKATASNPIGNSVEVKFDGELIQVRDSKNDDDGPVISFSRYIWKGFLEWVRDDPESFRDSGQYVIEGNNGDLFFTPDEWSAFVDGVRKGEFDVA